MKGYIFDIKHFAVHDGPGIRTTVFLKGCPLKCVWCHNPESIGKEKQLGYISHKCVNCGKCALVCPSGAHSIDNDGKHVFDRSKCILCGKCTKGCSAKVLTLYGEERDIELIEKELLEDSDFYDNGGGITLSGGECLTQASFCKELLKRMKAHGIHTAVDTSGFVGREAIEKVLPYTDLFLYDMKAFRPEIHEKCTGHTNEIILENLKFLDEMGKKIEIRIPYVPEYNDDEMEKIAEFLKSLKNHVSVRVLPYHNYAGTKYSSLNMKNTLPGNVPNDEEICKVKQIFIDAGIDTVN